MMKKNVYLIVFLFLYFVSWGCSSTGNEEQETAEAIRKPNIIYILADDLGYGDLSCYGQQKFETPHIDRLAAQGMRFTQHYAGTTVCAPSRSCLMTGQHSGHTTVRGNRGMHEGQFPIPDSIRLLPEILKEAGYVTGAFGKWGLGFPGSEGDPVNQGIDEFFGFNSQTIAHNYYPWELWHNKEKVILEENEGEKKGTYAPTLIQEKTLEFIEQHKDTSFFLYVPSILPHAELLAPEEYMAMFGEQSSPEPPYEFKSKFAPETPYEGVDDINHPRFKVGGYGSQPYPHAAFAAMITVLDDQVGQIVEKVKALGLAENTIIIFSSDNGPHLEGGADPDFFNSNGPLKGYKRDLYEGGIRVPMIACWPGKIEAGSQSDHISAFWDVLPTTCALAGIEAKREVDGISFLPELLDEGKQAEHAYLYWEFHEQGKKQAVRIDQWKGVKTGIAENPDAPLELYDLSVDIGEEHNIADQHPEIVDEMEQIMQHAHEEDAEWPFFAQAKE
ncbi:arylsulfatase [Catalinimonas niigatensis]|uniref:arylsulfatase n=1 Tax=Catalinimonas niigatensis TaxID=1397264 RepID=UPI002665F189|nr:sulfatase-like hydrolase/transferase [Catalinimonas niigatensis]WPP49207.1 sulfatase-like hydrolase/transferase [Catalinimonas niigatensis]